MGEVTRRGALGALTLPMLAAGGGSAAQEAAAPKPTFSLLLVNDIYRMDAEGGRGGFSKLAAVVKAERARGVPMLFCHAGDTFSPSLMSGFDHGAHIVELTNMVAPDVFVPGNHEFDFGQQVYFQRIGELKAPVFAANLRDAEDRPLPRHHDRRIYELGGVRVGLVGLALTETPLQSTPGDLKFGPIIDTLRQQTLALRQEGAEFIVAVTHTDRAMDFRIVRSKLVDVLLTGHDHDLAIEYDDEAAMVESNHDANFVTSVDVFVRRAAAAEGGAATLAWSPGFRIHDTLTVEPDPAVLARVRQLDRDLSRALEEPLAKLGVELDSRSASVRYRETAIGDLFADAIRAATGADAAMLNGGGIRGNRVYPAGATVTRRDVLIELPFGNKTVVVTVSGQQLRAALENGFSRLDSRAGRFPQVSGLKVEVDTARPAGARVVSVAVDGRPLEPKATYTLATNDFMLRGGDGYGMLAGTSDPTADTGNRLLANDVMAYLRKLGTVTIKTDDRIEILP
ncbi:bifunctional metallophosphatase/5'-nucleotidase [Chelatococcus reniformis]|uniref:Multifunctional 2',3'-cyclic-nucleotide 2'-phosphodiesterase/5'-nucleotidase/3'-nucleotidase n=1 Tax=Chelatococcus reniformis TaxID=1494448 RepID=A0A916XDK2_9HYPH|nr:bifunctional UDP-sugar hydrolase/5'-nucleotidase [Chelatococcus reniformis]GGC63838.1 multifunctional 2',3'-cyclic-nucleotide 2'-phosphodiesterase/5'-nucleotidase/3'-nucleotidase [Chelatococcus reniformis]